MATALLSPNAKQQFLTDAGEPAAGYALYTYAANTTTEQATFTNRAGTVPNSNPIILDARGEAIIYLTPGAVYDYVLKTAPDPGGSLVWTREDVIADAGEADAVIFLQNGTGAVSRPVQDKLYERVSVLDFMTSTERADVTAGTGSLDVTAAVQAAVSAHQWVDFPPGTYRISSVEVFFGRTLTGRGTVTKILADDDTSDVFRVTGSNVSISDMNFGNRNESLAPALEAYRTTGAYINVTGSRVQVANIYAQYGAIGIASSGTIVTVSDSEFRNFLPATGEPIRITSGADVSLYGVVMDNPGDQQPLAGVRIKSAADVTITDCNIIRCGYDLFCDPGNGEGVASLNAINTFFDTAVNGIRLTPTGTGTITRCFFVNCWASSHSSTGILASTAGGGTIKGVTFETPQVFLCGSDGINIAGTPTEDVVISGGSVSQNIGAGISVGNGVSGWTVRDVRSGPSNGVGGNAYGLFVGTGCTDYKIIDNDFLGNTTGNAALADTTTTADIHGNRGLAAPTFAPTFVGAWVNFGGSEATAGYWKDGEGLVHLQGQVKTGTIGTTIFQLPAGFRPNNNMQFPIVSAGAFGAVAIGSSGNVVAQSGSSAGLCLDGIVFKAA